MSDKKEDKETTPPQTQTQTHKHNQNELFSPFDYEQVSTSSNTNTTIITTKKPRLQQQWTPTQPQPGQPAQHPSPSQAQQLITSPDTSSSPTQPSHHPQFRKGKYVSPVWKPNEMLWLAKAWRAQYSPGPGPETGMGRGKTRAEKDKEVAEYLSRNGVNRDAKTAGTKWDNMLGEFRKVYEWERGREREQIGKSYFRLSPYERKIHRLPASFDEQVFEELSQFMGPKMRPSGLLSTSSGGGGSGSSGSILGFHHGLRTSSGDFIVKALPPPPPPVFRDDDYPISSLISARTRQMEQHLSSSRTNLRNPLGIGYDIHNHPFLEYGPSPSFAITTSVGARAEMRRLGRMRMTWEESVSLWSEEGEYQRGRVKLHGSNLFNSDSYDELVYFDESMVVSPLESFQDGPLKGFSLDTFLPGQQLNVFGRRKSTSSYSTPPHQGEYLDPTEYHLGCLRVLPGTLPSLVELPWYIQEPPPEELRMPLRKDIYRDLPQGRELFFITSSDPLDCKSFTIDVLSSLIRSNPSISASTSTSRDSYIALWDDCINRVVAKFCPTDMVFIRKQSKVNTSTTELLQDEWPNLTGIVKSLCLWRGEEIDRRRDSSQCLIDPSSSITSKFSWTYGDLPYVLGYYAVGHNVTFCALSPLQKPSSSISPHRSEITRTDLYSIDLSNPSERLKSIVPCWRIGILLASLAEKCPKFCESDFHRRDLGDGNVIEMTPNTVTKFYPSKRTWLKVKEIYDMLHERVPHAEQLISRDENDLSLVFRPRGIKTKPKNCEQLVLALKQVTKALVALHDLSFMHRDLSWDKVMLRSITGLEEDNEWFVTGFEETVGAPQINPRVSVEGSGMHAPEMARGVHGVKVDVWGVGFLVKTSGVQVTKGEENIVGKQLRELEEKCMDQNPEVRPTAADCYHHLLQIQTSLGAR